MKTSLFFLTAITISFGTVSVFAVDKKPANPAAVPVSAPAAAAPAANAAAPAAGKAASGKEQTLCPKCNNKILKKSYLDSDGKRIYFCGSICAASMKKDVAGVMAKLEAEGIALVTVEKKAEKKKK